MPLDASPQANKTILTGLDRLGGTNEDLWQVELGTLCGNIVGPVDYLLVRIALLSGGVSFAGRIECGMHYMNLWGCYLWGEVQRSV